ncbi:NADH:ubiquinone oxidoreductase intermediate-associated protein 30 [Vararia minispora EC-137]|uniref:NADH:ubiquinone oxidoreductase intermediate-associated protein 30 n=1 Tax=Vararia minispora EC-137 TaxID=1314806 RepID=A0ACB8QBI1_9AGAM|nr:NADH:ubiquinone oxidoreductase intermediate-associated protein 30 [Vararia minispora EC-137]
MMNPAYRPPRTPKLLYKVNTPEQVYDIVTGCDADIGGTSTVKFDLDERPDVNAPLGKPATGKFWGMMRLGIRPELRGKVRGGYAGFRNRLRPTLFGNMTDDLSFHDFLALRLRVGGHPRTRNSYFVNVQVDTSYKTDLWQHRLAFHRDDGGWEDIFLPLDAFVLTNTGEVASHQIKMDRAKVKSVGISILGGNTGIEGPYELGVDEIRACIDVDEP